MLSLSLLFSSALQAFVLQAEPTAVMEAVAETSSISLFSMAAKGGWLMLVLLLLSVLAVYIFGERMVVLKKVSRTDPHFMNNIKEYIYEGKVQAAMHLCEDQNTLTSRLVLKGLQSLGRPLPDIRSSVENCANREVAALEKGLTTLASISGGAPMIGFLGTVVGMIRAFYNMSMAGNNIDITLLSGGIYTAMVTTVGGLIVGIPAYFAYNYLNSRVNKVVNQMERDTIDFIEMLEEPVK